MSTNNASFGSAYCKPISGANNTTGKPQTSQCANTLAVTNNVNGCGASNICSKLPSAKSAANKRVSESIPANNAATHKTPGAILLNTAGSGPMPSGNKLETIKKKNSVVATSERLRKASKRSRFSTVIHAPFINLTSKFESTAHEL